MMGLVSALGYWLWTNAGSWMLSGMYPHTLSGFVDCYWLALPYLKDTVFGALIWTVVLKAILGFLSTADVKNLRMSHSRS